MPLPLAGIFNAHGAAVLNENACGLRLGDDGEIGALQGWRQVAGGGTRAPAIGHGAIDGAETLLARAVEIGGIRIARLLAGLDPGQIQRPADAGPRNLERAIAAVMPVSPWQIGFRLLEIGQDIVPGPAAIAKLRPYVVVAWHAPYIDHGVYGTRPAQHSAARPEQRASVHSGLRLGMVAPVDDAGLHERRIAGRHMDKEILVARACLQQRNLEPGIGREPVCQRTPSGPAPDNDVIVGHGTSRLLFQI